MQVVIANGLLYTKQPADLTLTSRALPSGVSILSPRPCGTQLRRAGFMNGRTSPAMIYRDDLDVFYKATIDPPVSAPGLATTGEPAGLLTGQSIGYMTWIQKSGSTIVTESGPSPASNAGFATVHNKGQRLWTLPTVAPNARTTHKGLYVRWNGAQARHVADIPLATGSYTEQMSALEFGRLMELDGGAPPYAVYCATHVQRVWVAGIPAFPDRIYFSNFGDAESFGPDNYLQTTSGKAVTGIVKLGEVLVVFTHMTTDIIVGTKPDNFVILPKDPTIGCISHHSIRNIFNRIWFASQDGVRTYDGSFRYLMSNLRDYWYEEYKANPSYYENSFAEVDFDTHSYLLTLDKPSPTIRYVGYYLPFEPAVGGGEGQPWWFLDTRNRRDTAMARVAYAGSTTRTKLVTGSSDGYIREENVYTNADDDGDLGLKPIIIQPKHLFMNDPAGGSESGKQLITLHSYVQAEETTWSLNVHVGDESIADTPTSPSVWSRTIPGSFLSETIGGVLKTYVAKTIHIHDEVEKISGRGFTFRYQALSPKNFFWRGLGGTFSMTGPGDYRPRVL